MKSHVVGLLSMMRKQQWSREAGVHTARQREVLLDKWRAGIARRGAVWILLSLAALSVMGVAVYRHVRWKRFGVVESASVYRSGELTEAQLSRAIDRLGLKTVICLEPALADRESVLCERMGVGFHRFDIHSSGEGRVEDYRRVVDLMSDPSLQPVLVHCQAGVARTGASVALYRVLKGGWTLEDALEELRSFERKGRCSPALVEQIEKVIDQASVEGNTLR